MSSPPGSRHSNSNSNSAGAYEQQQGYQLHNAVQDGMWTGEQQGQRAPRSLDVLQPENIDFLFNASWGTDMQDAAIDPLLYGNGFVPDTGKSCSNWITITSVFHMNTTHAKGMD